MGGRVSLEGTSGWNEGGFWTSITPPHVPDLPRLLCSELLLKIFKGCCFLPNSNSFLFRMSDYFFEMNYLESSSKFVLTGVFVAPSASVGGGNE